MEGLTLLLGFLAVDQEFHIEEINLVELDPLNTLFGQHNYRHGYFITATFSHYLPSWELGGYVHPFIFDTANGIAPLFLLELIFFFMASVRAKSLIFPTIIAGSFPL